MIQHKKRKWIAGITLTIMLCIGACSEKTEMFEKVTPTMEAEQDILTPGVSYHIENGEVIIIAYEGEAGEIVIPTKVDGLPVTRIEDRAFIGNRNLRSIKLPTTITSIGDKAFCGCNNLSGITIPSGINNIGVEAFYSCTDLSSIELPATLTNIEISAFEGCTGLESIVIPSQVSTISASAFFDCWGLKNIELDFGVTNIEACAFGFCTDLESIRIPSSVTNIAENAFYGSKKVVLLVSAGSYAHEYAKKYSLKHKTY